MKIKKMSFSSVENILSKEETKYIIGGTATIPDMESEQGGGGGSDERFGVTGFGQASFVSGSSMFSSYGNSSGSSIGFGSGSSTVASGTGWSTDANGNLTTSNPAVIGQFVDFLVFSNAANNSSNGASTANPYGSLEIL